MKAVQRQDGSTLLRPEIALGKAFGALALGLGGRELARRAPGHAGLHECAVDISGGRRCRCRAGCWSARRGAILGAVGISGDVSAQDEVCAVAGIVAAGPGADTGDPD